MPSSRARRRRNTSLQGIREELIARLRARTPEIEDAILACVRAVASGGQGDIEYEIGQREAVAAAVEYGLAAVEHAQDPHEQIPPAVGAQARRAAQGGVSLDTVLRRFIAGDRRLGEFILEEADGFSRDAVLQIMRARGPHVDRLVALVSNEYGRELDGMRRSPAQHLAEWVQGVLDGKEPADPDHPGYRFDAWHLGMVATGPGLGHELQGLAARLESEALVVPRGDNTAWVWLGRRRPVAFAEVERQLAGGSDLRLRLAVGESRRDVTGWRLTHREAQAAQQVMRHQPQAIIRCGHVAVLVSLLRDELLSDALIQTHLLPLEGRGNAGRALRETLRAYFATGGNTAATATALRVSRHTIHRRLRKVEQQLGRLLDACHSEVEIALRIEELLDRSPQS